MSDPTAVQNQSAVATQDAALRQEDDAAQLNALLRMTWAPSNYNSIRTPPQVAPLQKDHFLEVQHFVAILIRIMKGFGEYDNWYTQQVGYFIDLATFVNEHRNLFEINDALNQRKKRIPLDQYRTNADIRAYLQYQTTGGITVEQSVRALLDAMVARSTPFGKYTRLVGQEFKRQLGW
ncbi:hypothetical protein VNI00_003193 [Paramarasmius palmivorus]|uniref:Uncharacterized protein n=1 Tax=Paramarasmius palmivorus TaxID=297713 RepID=A0AAW0DTX9_9AGAR